MCVFCTERFRVIGTADESKQLTASKMPSIVISASGMAEGGRVLHHLKAALPNPRNTVLFAGLPGRRHARTTARGRREERQDPRRVGAGRRVDRADRLDVGARRFERNHALATRFHHRAAQTFIVHGEPVAQDALAARMQKELGWTVARAAARGEGRVLAVRSRCEKPDPRSRGARRHPSLPPRTRRRGGRRPAVCRRLRRSAASREDAHLPPLPGRDRRTRHLLRPAIRAQPGDARRARRRSSRTRPASIPARSPRSSATPSSSGSTRGRTTTSPRASSFSSAAPMPFARRLPRRERNGASPVDLDRLLPVLLRPRRRSDRDQQDPGCRARTSSRRAPTTSTRA